MPPAPRPLPQNVSQGLGTFLAALGAGGGQVAGPTAAVTAEADCQCWGSGGDTGEPRGATPLGARGRAGMGDTRGQLSTPSRVPKSPGALWLFWGQPITSGPAGTRLRGGQCPWVLPPHPPLPLPSLLLPRLLAALPPRSSLAPSTAQPCPRPRPPPRRSSVPGSWDPLGIRRGIRNLGIRTGKGEGGESRDTARLPFPLQGGEGKQKSRKQRLGSLRAGLGVPCLHLLPAGHRLPTRGILGEFWGR